ncbi:TIGR03435 family protein [Terriglobus saanensis]|nr:TIGR03435 family protein [Terriglobus saanensis]
MAAVGMVFAPAGRCAQTTNPPLAFDAASIRKNVNNIGVCSPEQVQATPSGFRLTNCPLIVALGTAYVPMTGEALGFVIGMGDRIVGMPDWMKSEHYDIVARISDADAEAWKDPARQKVMLRAMLQTLLAERCKLVVHREMKERPVFAIVVGKNGPKLKAAETTDMDALHTKYPNAMTVPGGGGMLAGRTNGGSDLHGATIGTLSLVLSYPAGRPVVDKTGLTGRYDIEVPRMQNLTADNAGADGAPTIFEVVERFGLKLEIQKDPVEMLAVDHVERPSEN